jgi:hypothetical protein
MTLSKAVEQARECVALNIGFPFMYEDVEDASSVDEDEDAIAAGM